MNSAVGASRTHSEAPLVSQETVPSTRVKRRRRWGPSAQRRSAHWAARVQSGVEPAPEERGPFAAPSPQTPLPHRRPREDSNLDPRINSPRSLPVRLQGQPPPLGRAPP